jgi:predicted RNA methylase
MNMFSYNPDFYPTPKEVIAQMMMGEDIVGKTILEPSAGSGNIVDWLKENGAKEVIACENDPTLLRILRGKCDILAEDFLTVTSEQVSHCDYIVMNPPFSHGAEHILHAFDIAPAGCTVVALCNSDNLESYRRERNKRTLQETIDLYGHSQWLGDVFKTAERRTGVSVSLIKLYKPGEGASEFDGYFFSAYDEDQANVNNKEGIMHYNLVRELVGRYVSAVKLFDETLAAAEKINEAARCPDAGQYEYIPIRFATVTSDGHTRDITHEQYKKALQKYYWRIIFDKLHMQKYATKHLREQINKFIETQQNVPFTMGNIYRVIDMVIQTTGQRMNKAMEEAFDLICSLSAENSTAGETWKTNANYMVNRKFIVNYVCEGYDPYGYDKYGQRCNQPHQTLHFGYSNTHLEQMEDVCKALCHLTGCNYDCIESLASHGARASYDESGEEWGKWFHWGFFRCKAFKKGTMHFEFLDEDVWYKFNYEVAKMKGWALPKKKAV